MLTVEDLIRQAIREGKMIRGVNDPQTLKKIAEGRRDIQEDRVHTEEEIDALIDRWAIEQMFSFRRPPDATDRIVNLMEKSTYGTITECEQAELNHYIDFELTLKQMKKRIEAERSRENRRVN